jgi:hypothetical protein
VVGLLTSQVPKSVFHAHFDCLTALGHLARALYTVRAPKTHDPEVTIPHEDLLAPLPFSLIPSGMLFLHACCARGYRPGCATHRAIESTNATRKLAILRRKFEVLPPLARASRWYSSSRVALVLSTP